MARSYKKHPVVKDNSGGMKAVANRKVRRILKQNLNLDVADGNAYRKLFNSWDISDWCFRETWREYQACAERYRKEYENGVCRYGYRMRLYDDMSYWQWYKMYKRK